MGPGRRRGLRDQSLSHVARHSSHARRGAQSWGKELRWAWPRDGRRETLEGAGIALAEQYRAQGLNMLRDHAQFDDGRVSVEAGLMAMLDRMQTDKLKIYAHLNDWFEERRMYHRKDGKVVKLGDDLMSATRYGVMMLRHARSPKGIRVQSEADHATSWDCLRCLGLKSIPRVAAKSLRVSSGW